MCGIVGLYLKKKSLHSKLGAYLSEMLTNMSSRGPDSAGFAIYNNSKPDQCFKFSISFPINFNLNNFQNDINNQFKDIKTKKIVKNFDLSKFSGSHAIGHTRMATESAITLDGSHPYSTGEDECLVHNGSLSNHNNLRRKLLKKGIKFDSLNDTEVAAGYISNELSKNKSMKKTLTNCLKDLDGFYTFIAGTNKGFAILRDEIACKPAVIAENNDYVAIASEFQAMAHLPKVNNAKIYEPEPGVVYTWGK